MVRIWGGGIYEDDSFYSTADELGILIWQDFLFACGQYPCHLEFRENVEREAKTQIKRLRHHPSIVIFAGNNEDYQLAESVPLEWDPNDHFTRIMAKNKLPSTIFIREIITRSRFKICSRGILSSRITMGSRKANQQTKQ